MTEAAAELGISVRTLQRRIQAGELQAKIEGGRRLVEVELSASAETTQKPPGGGDAQTHTTSFANRERPPGGDTADNPAILSASIVERAQQQAAALSVMADRVSGLATGRIDELRADTARARRSAALGWTLAAAGFVMAAGATIWGIRQQDTTNARLAAAEASAAVLGRDVEAERARAIELQGQLVRLADTNARRLADAGESFPFRPVSIP